MWSQEWEWVNRQAALFWIGFIGSHWKSQWRQRFHLQAGRGTDRFLKRRKAVLVRLLLKITSGCLEMDTECTFWEWGRSCLWFWQKLEKVTLHSWFNFVELAGQGGVCCGWWWFWWICGLCLFLVWGCVTNWAAQPWQRREIHTTKPINKLFV